MKTALFLSVLLLCSLNVGSCEKITAPTTTPPTITEPTHRLCGCTCAKTRTGIFLANFACQFAGEICKVSSCNGGVSCCLAFIFTANGASTRGREVDGSVPYPAIGGPCNTRRTTYNFFGDVSDGEGKKLFNVKISYCTKDVELGRKKFVRVTRIIQRKLRTDMLGNESEVRAAIRSTAVGSNAFAVGYY